MKPLIAGICLVSAAACSYPPPRLTSVDPEIKAQLPDPAVGRKPPAGALPDQALLPPLRMEMPAVQGRPMDPRFDLSVNNAPAAQVFMSIVSGTRYSMLLNPEVSGTIGTGVSGPASQPLRPLNVRKLSPASMWTMVANWFGAWA